MRPGLVFDIMSDNKELKTKLERVFENVFHELPSEERCQISRLNSTMWDSVIHLLLILSLEEEFGIALDQDDVIDITSFDSALAVINSKLLK